MVVTIPICGTSFKNSRLSCRVSLARDKLAFFPDLAVGKAWDIPHVDTGAHRPTAFSDGFQSKQYKVADSSEQDGNVEWIGRYLIGPNRSDSAQRTRGA